MIRLAIEYLYDCIRATAGEDISICALITDDDGNNITDNCYMRFYDDETELAKIYGAYDGEQWLFTIPAEYTKDITGRYWYTIGKDFTDMCFKSPIYLI